LTELWLDSNYVTNIYPLVSLTGLTDLLLWGNQISDITPLTLLTSLCRLGLGMNEVFDISPLVDNSGLSAGDDVDLMYNYLDLTAGSQAMRDIQTLLDRGVYVSYEPQRLIEDMQYELTIHSTVGGATTPTEGTHAYDSGTAVDLLAMPDNGYQFAGWTGDTDTVADVGAASTTIIMNDDYEITANFEPTAESVQTSTGTGTAHFTASHGVIEDLEALPVPPEPPAGYTFPHGIFSFKVTDLDYDGQTATVTIDLPTPVPAGTKWWKYHDGQWHDYGIPITISGNTVTITLTDGGAGDIDDIAGQITDPGGPGNPMSPLTVGWEGSPVNKAGVMAPWIALLAVMAGASLLILQRRRAQI